MKYITLFLMILNGYSYAKEPNILWQKTFGGTTEDFIEIGQRTLVNSDGSFILAGYSTSTNGDVTGHIGSYDFWVVKLDLNRNIQWQRNLGGASGDYAYSIQQTFDGGYIVAGHTTSINGDVSGYHGGGDIWIVKLDAVGFIVWQKALGGTKGDFTHSIIQTIDGGFIVAGNTNSNDGDVSGYHGGGDIWIVKLDNNGLIEWNKTFGGSSKEEIFAILQTNDGGYFASGWSASTDGDIIGNHGDDDIWAFKLDPSGNLEWQKTLGGSFGERAFSATITDDNNFIVGGYTQSVDGDINDNNGLFDYWIVKLSSTGNLIWEHTFGGSGIDIARTIANCSDGGYIIGGETNSMNGDITSNHGAADQWIIKIDENGNLIWQKCLGGTKDDRLFSINEVSFGKYILAGWTDSNNGDVIGNHGNADYWIVELGCAIQSIFYSDEDSDGFGNPDNFIYACESPEGYVSISGDKCPLNGNKLLPGVCGCELEDTDTDGDGLFDCEDGCPEDFNKGFPGDCGCNVDDLDSDCDGVSDCIDICPGGNDLIDNNNDDIPDCSQSIEYELYSETWKCGSNKLKVCHNENNRHTICVNKNALASHISHGDFFGPCIDCNQQISMNKITNATTKEKMANSNTVVKIEGSAKLDQLISIFPNPTHDYVDIHFSKISQVLKICLLDINGNLVNLSAVNYFGNIIRIQMNPNEVINGVYFLQLTFSDGVVVRKLTIE